MSESDVAIRDEEAFPLPSGVRSTETALDFSSATSLDYNEWETLGARLGRIHGVVQWWLGDWFVFGECRYRDGEMYQQALEATGRSIGGLYTLKWVAGSVPPEARRADLSWSHHREVAKLSPGEQRIWLARAADKHWSVDLLGDTIRADADLSTRRDPQPVKPTDKGPNLSTVPESEPVLVAAQDPLPEPAQLQVDWPALREVVAEIVAMPRDDHGRVCLGPNLIERLRAALEAA